MRDSLAEFDGIVYLVDAMDFESSKAELDGLLADKAISKPLLVLVQKPDASGVADEQILMQELCLGEAIAKVRNCIVQQRSMYEPRLCTRGMGGLPCLDILCLLYSSKDTKKVSQIIHILVTEIEFHNDTITQVSVGCWNTHNYKEQPKSCVRCSRISWWVR